MTDCLPTTVMPGVEPARLLLVRRVVVGPSPTIAPWPTTTSLSRIARSTTAPDRITVSNITIESRTTAPDVDPHARRQHAVDDRAR